MKKAFLLICCFIFGVALSWTVRAFCSEPDYTLKPNGIMVFKAHGAIVQKKKEEQKEAQEPQLLYNEHDDNYIVDKDPQGEKK